MSATRMHRILYKQFIAVLIASACSFFAVAQNTAVTQNALLSPADGPGGPILVISNTANPFSRYAVEILRAEGLNEFAALDITAVSAAVLTNYDVAVLGEMPLTGTQVTMLTDWVNAGGTLITFKPDVQLAPLLGITPASGTMANKYLLVSTASGPGVGIVNQTIQYHGAANQYTLSGATSLATLYSDASTATSYPAVTSRSVGANGGVAIAFTYDLARSVVYTRQGNPAWSGDERDGTTPIRSDDLFFGAKAGDVQTDWVDLNKVAIPQADEQQHLLANIILQNNFHRKPLPRLWFLPKGAKAAVVMTGDDHGNGGTVGRFDQYYNASTGNTQADVDNWVAIRGTSYIFPNTPITNAQIADLQSKGFEIGLHLNTGCNDFTPASYENDLTSQTNDLVNNFPDVANLVTNRTHCIVWSDWASEPKIESQHGIRLDANYYYWPGSWVNDRPGMFTGSGMPMRFADLDGSLIDCYQVATQMTDESGQSFPATINSLLDKATGPEGYYGVFCANMHTDAVSSAGSDAIVAAAVARQIPVISAKQMLKWLDARNNSSFSNFNWNANQLDFTITADADANNIQGMLPRAFNSLRLASITKNGSPLSFTTQLIKGIEYAFFNSGSGNYIATYVACTTPAGTITTVSPICQGQSVSLTLAPPVTGQAPFDLIVNGLTYNNVTPGVPFTTFAATEYSIWGNTGSPVSPSVQDNNQPIETGVKFRASANGYITGIRFYKGPANTGTHTGRLWTTGGAQLATVVFTNETATGWQEAHFSTPVAITAGQTYIASYLSSDGWFAYTEGGLTSQVATPLLTALASGTEGVNGVYKYGGGFPDGGLAANYWVDVLFTQLQPGNNTLTYTLTSLTDHNGCNNAGADLSTTTVTVLPPPTGTLTLSNLACAGQNLSLTFNANPNNGPYSLVINGNTYNNITSGTSFTSSISANTTSNYSIWNNSTIGGSQTVDNSAVELGVDIRSSIGGTITGIRFYKTDAVVRTYTGSLWDPSNPSTPLATASLVTDNTIGWKQIDFSSPVNITVNTTYAASYFSPDGYYAYTSGGLNSAIPSGPLTALGSRYGYSNGSFPNNSNNANYWVDVVFVTQGFNTLNLTSITDAAGCHSSGAPQTISFLSAQCASLPVSLTNLTATPQGKKVTVKWTTSSEFNNLGFEVQRSIDGVNWTTLGFVNGAGTTTVTRYYTYIDDNLLPKKYYYRLKQIDIDNHFKYSLIVSATVTGKTEFSLGQNYPNPFRSATTITFTLPEKRKVTLSLFDTQGRLISVLLSETRIAGEHTVNFNSGRLSSGVYYYKLETDDFSAIRKMVIE